MPNFVQFELDGVFSMLHILNCLTRQILVFLRVHHQPSENPVLTSHCQCPVELRKGGNEWDLPLADQLTLSSPAVAV